MFIICSFRCVRFRHEVSTSLLVAFNFIKDERKTSACSLEPRRLESFRDLVTACVDTVTRS